MLLVIIVLDFYILVLKLYYNYPYFSVAYTRKTLAYVLIFYFFYYIDKFLILIFNYCSLLFL